MLLCLGLDYKRGGFVDRALEAFTEVLRLDPDNQLRAVEPREALRRAAPVGRGLRDAPEARRAAGRADAERRRHNEMLAFLENEIGLEALKRRDYAEAARRFDAAIELRRRRTRRRISISATSASTRATSPARSRSWERLIDASPERAYLAFSRLEGAYPKLGERRTLRRRCADKLIAANPQDWRARLALARHSARRSGRRRGAGAAVRRARRSTRTRSRCTRRSGRRCRSCTCRRRSSTATST